MAWDEGNSGLKTTIVKRERERRIEAEGERGEEGEEYHLCNNATSAAAACTIIVGTSSSTVGASLNGSPGLDTRTASLLLLSGDECDE